MNEIASERPFDSIYMYSAPENFQYNQMSKLFETL